MKIGIIGAGRLGICFALLCEAAGHPVLVSDIREDYVESLNDRHIDTTEPEVQNLLREAERFDRHLDRLRRKGEGVDYVSICSPNYLHDSHIRLSLRNQCNVICEKPLVLIHEHLEALKTIEEETDKSINTILQLRYHPTIVALKEKWKY